MGDTEKHYDRKLFTTKRSTNLNRNNFLRVLH